MEYEIINNVLIYAKKSSMKNKMCNQNNKYHENFSLK